MMLEINRTMYEQCCLLCNDSTHACESALWSALQCMMECTICLHGMLHALLVVTTAACWRSPHTVSRALHVLYVLHVMHSCCTWVEEKRSVLYGVDASKQSCMS